MPNKKLVPQDETEGKGQLGEQEKWRDNAPTVDEIRADIYEHVGRVIAFTEQSIEQGTNFYHFEKALIPLIFAIGRLFLCFFLCAKEHDSTRPDKIRADDGRQFKLKDPAGRWLGTFFGKIRYWRAYMCQVGGAKGAGFHPLDTELGLTADGFSIHVLSLVTWIATKLSYTQSVVALQHFLLWSPSKNALEEAILGFGRHTSAWFESCPAPEKDGEVLIIQFDSKATPTATEQELKKRRGKRRANPHPESARHRGRVKRRKLGRKKRRKKGDKSKNGKMATLVVMYTLKRSDDGKLLLGPMNKRIYASYAPKRHAFAIARREADKRGFREDSGKLIQILTDGDEDLACYAKQFFPKAIHNIDIMHVNEHIWDAGRCIYKEGSELLEQWVENQKKRLYNSNAKEIITELEGHMASIPRTGPGNKAKREKLTEVHNYLQKRIEMMDYKFLLAQDLEIATGQVEGAVKYVIASRFDNGGMRWIKERSEALLQLRCIEINGDWDRFIEFVNKRFGVSSAGLCTQKLLTDEPGPLPTLGIPPQSSSKKGQAKAKKPLQTLDKKAS